MLFFCLPSACVYIIFALSGSSLASPIASPSPTPGPDQGLTIWPEATLTTMKAQRQNLYEYALAMYQHRDYFDDPANCVNPPIPNPRYAIGAPCPRANLLAAVGLDHYSIAWHETCKTMFPLNFGLPDNSHEPKASFSDFAHFLNSMNAQVIYIHKAAQYLACRYGFNDDSSTQRSLGESYRVYTLIYLGPIDPRTNYTQINGTMDTYSDAYGHPHYEFENAISPAYTTINAEQSILINIMVYQNRTGPPHDDGNERCAYFAKHGLEAPVDEY